MANRIQKRRGAIFHSAPQMNEQDVREFFEEIRAATGLLMLHTFKDLGIDIAALAGNYTGLRDLRGFLIPPERPTGSSVISEKKREPTSTKASGQVPKTAAKSRKAKRSVADLKNSKKIRKNK